MRAHVSLQVFLHERICVIFLLTARHNFSGVRWLYIAADEYSSLLNMCFLHEHRHRNIRTTFHQKNLSNESRIRRICKPPYQEVNKADITTLSHILKITHYSKQIIWAETMKLSFDMM